jgi:excisionase family DNA binding protein
MIDPTQEVLLSEFKRAIAYCPKFGSVSFVAHFHSGRVTRIEHGLVEAQKLEEPQEPVKKTVSPIMDVQVSSPAPRLLSVKEAAELLRISIPTIHRYIKIGQIKVIRIGSRILISTKETDRIINGA